MKADPKQLASSPAEAVPDRVWLAELYELHASDVRRVLLRLLGPDSDAEDALQEVFLVALRRREELLSPGPWLYGVAVRTAQSRIRYRKLRRFLGLEAALSLPAEADAADGLNQQEASRLVYAALERLSAKKRTVFVLYELEGMRGEQIATVLRCPIKTVWSRLRHARVEFAVAVKRLLEPPRGGER